MTLDRRNPYRAQTGFTLVELLVVISVIAVLMAILLPALRRVRELGRRTKCMAQMRQLYLAWYTYAMDNEGRLVNGQAWLNGDLTQNEGVPWLVNDRHGPNKYNDTATAADAREAMQTGALAPYIDDGELYLCPSRYRHIAPWIGEGAYWFSSYSIVASMNTFTSNQWRSVKQDLSKLRKLKTQPSHFWKLSQIVGTSPGDRLVFADNGCWAGHGWYAYSMIHALTVSGDNPIAGSSYVLPPVHHSQGTNMAFADGHVEYWKWKNSDTLALGKEFRDAMAGEEPPDQEAPFWYLNPNNEDGNRVLEGIWGTSRVSRRPLEP